MPPEGVSLRNHQDILSFEEIAAVAEAAVALGMDKIRITGGEPLVRREILTLVGMLGQIRGISDYAMTTNGVYLARFAVALKQAGLHRLNISLDTLDPERYRRITRGGELARVLDGIETAQNAGFQTIKLNCVIGTSPDEPDALSVAAFGREKGLEVRFIRRMDISNGHFWPVIGGDGGNCQICNRLRLSSDGKIFPCLFSDLAYSIRELGIETALLRAIENKPASGTRSEKKFYKIGG